MKKYGPPRTPIKPGTKFGTATYVTDVESTGRRRSLFICQCGNEFVSAAHKVIAGDVKGCGCLKGLNLIGRAPTYKHGFAGKNGQRSSEYSIWNMMRSRCHNPNNKAFPRYGGRGIKVCERWKSFENFIADVGARPSKAHSLDRINNDGDYEPSNVRWALPEQQAANRSDNRWIEHNGKTLPLFLWAKESGVAASVIHKRLKRGWTFARAIGQEVLL